MRFIAMVSGLGLLVACGCNQAAGIDKDYCQVAPPCPQGPPGEQGPPGSQGPSGATGIKFAGLYSAMLDEDRDGVLTSTLDPLVLKFLDIKSNTAYDVFSIEPDGSIKIDRPGVVSATATVHGVAQQDLYVRLNALMNGNLVAMGYANATQGDVTVSNTVHLHVTLGDHLSFETTPAGLKSFFGGSLAMTWIGVE